MVNNRSRASARKSTLGKRSSSSRTNFGPISTISSAPVAIGNSMRGSKPVVTVTVDGCRVQGRDFAFTVGSTVAAATDWTLVGGMPLTPCVMPATTLKSYVQMYGLFRFNALAVHYITSSSTTQTGDVMFYYERDRQGPAIDCTSSSFLPFVLSDDNTVIGPQWTNHTAMIRPDKEFKTSDYGMNLDLNEEANGSVFIYSKTSAANSPGYVLFDYDITFKQLQSNPRAGILPVTRGQWSQCCIGNTTLATTAGNAAVPVIQGKTIAGTSAAIPTGSTAGDVFKVVFDVTNSTVSGVNAAWTNVTASTLFGYQGRAANIISTTIDDGFTCYGYYDSNGGYLQLFSTLEGAMLLKDPFVHNVTATITYNLCISLSLVANANARLQNSY